MRRKWAVVCRSREMAGRKNLMRRIIDALIERRAKQADYQIERYLAGR